MKEYVSLRQTAVSEALSSNAAILLQDKKTAESHNDAYNKADKKATSMAGSCRRSGNRPSWMLT